MAGREPPLEQPAVHTSGQPDLGALLAAREFERAVSLYYQADSTDEVLAAQYREVLVRFLGDCLERCTATHFLSLIDAWLGSFYDDTEALLALAEFQRRQSAPEAAADTLLLARTYSLVPQQRRRVDAALQNVVATTDEQLTGELRTIELLGFYEYLASIDFTRREYQLRRAQLYLQGGETQRGRDLLQALIAVDDGSDPRWSAALTAYESEATAELVPLPVPSDALPLARLGEGYLVQARLNEGDELTLLLDTGASITSLSGEAFARLHRPAFALRGSQLFNTANGYTRGDIYQAQSLLLGGYVVEEPDIAVLNYQPVAGVDGLLGMNVLRYFQFEIDQTNSVLHLRPR